jgi:branched-chain amino acid transport system permease protein
MRKLGLFPGRDAPLGGRTLTELAGPIVLLVVVALVGSAMSPSIELQFRSAIVTVSIVVALYVFIGNSGVISFGHISFVAVGAFAAALVSIPQALKLSVSPNLFGFIASASAGNAASLAIAAAVGGLYALLVGIPLMRLSGLAAGIATFAVLAITYNVLRNWDRIGPGAKTLSLIPETSSFWQATIGAVCVCLIAYGYQRTRFGRMLRATREDPAAAAGSGIRVHGQRLIAFTLSGALAGFAGGLLVHLLGSITTDQVYLDLTFTTLAMLIIGGVGSLWGAVVGALLISGLNSLLAEAEKGIGDVDLPTGTRLVTLGALMALVLLFRPVGVTRGREFALPRGRWRRLTRSRRPAPPEGEAI